MSWLSSGLSAIGISKSVQRGVVRAATGGMIDPGGGSSVAVTAAQVAEAISRKYGNPLEGVVAPGKTPLDAIFGTDAGGSFGLGPGAGVRMQGVIGGSSTTAPAGGCPRGYHLSKPRRGQVRRCVRNRSMNASNGRANKRALTRIKRATKQARKLFAVTYGKAGKVKPKFGRKK